MTTLTYVKAISLCNSEDYNRFGFFWNVICIDEEAGKKTNWFTYLLYAIPHMG